jgi:two-component system response regulator GlrR
MPQKTTPPAVELVLYVSSDSPYAHAARRDCELLLDRFDRSQVLFEVCDVGDHPDRAEADGVCFTPMLLKRHPLPRTYVIGNQLNAAVLVDLLESCGLEPLK